MTSALVQIPSDVMRARADSWRGLARLLFSKWIIWFPFPAARCLLGNFHLVSLTREPIVNVSAKCSDLSVRLSCLITALKGQSRLMESTSGVGRETVFYHGWANTWGQPNHSSRSISLFPLQLLHLGLFASSHRLEKRFLGKIPACDVAAGDADSAGFPRGGKAKLTSPRPGGICCQRARDGTRQGCCQPHRHHPLLPVHSSGWHRSVLGANVSAPPFPSPLWPPSGNQHPRSSAQRAKPGDSLLLSHLPSVSPALSTPLKAPFPQLFPSRWPNRTTVALKWLSCGNLLFICAHYHHSSSVSAVHYIYFKAAFKNISPSAIKVPGRIKPWRAVIAPRGTARCGPTQERSPPHTDAVLRRGPVPAADPNTFPGQRNAVPITDVWMLLDIYSTENWEF